MAPKRNGQTRKKMQKVAWNGVIYSKTVFLDMIHRAYPDTVYWRMKGDRVIPPGKIKKTDLEGWMAFSGAHFV